MRRTPQLQRRHFELIARTIRDIPDPEAKHAAKAFLAALRPTNAGFKPDRFSEACGLNGGGHDH